MQTTLDGLLNRRVMVEQPAKGFRIAIDTVLLAAAIPAKAGEKILDFGCGVGGAMLCLAVRVSGIHITGIEIQDELAELCRGNIARNHFQDRLNVVRGDVTDPLSPDIFPLSSFDHVMINPPYHDEARHDVSEHAGKRIANTEKSDDLPLWIRSAARALRPSGRLTIIHRADRRDEIFKSLSAHFGSVEVLPILPMEGVLPKRIILCARRSAEIGPIKQWQALILHKGGGGYSDAAECILREGGPLACGVVT